ncbi:MAG: hypothetical protein KJ970_03310 [Candidatus Eisenbacteria bacterium]|uniref:DUF946 domain-containing protein n=1 Tax=Eiseniibacteriota bacterium TaxID=2212470 RepID=A0A948RXA2_UNCEI|nr:hypothetical protein [Candidatus Eisenbacteria bacterium]MBU1948457.1 hypothetical protein [Candidatus Eisenbacteria bacterium]MBU2689929.1 hypothetical protein [Candidatus Eisenbacteria bacterium]
MDESTEALDLPPDAKSKHAFMMAQQYAPELRFHKSERHFPSDPREFRRLGRFRESRPGKDQGWNKTIRDWVEGDQKGEAFEDISWNDIAEETRRRFPFSGQFDPPGSPNLRPRDSKNRYSPGSAKGLFLQRTEKLSDKRSGYGPFREAQVSGRVFVDTKYDPEKELVHVLYWFFYELNWWRFFITHEGDWEHVTLLFTKDAFTQGHEPAFVYFAQHDTGTARRFEKMTFSTERHPVVYVDPNGHPCKPSVKDSHSYPLQWKTWTNFIEFVPQSKWRDFAGAWGEIGQTTHTTGPLGPYFKRHSDKVKVVVKNGGLHIKES